MPDRSHRERFEQEMYELYERTVRECSGRYRPTAFFRMLELYGAEETAHRLLAADADFFAYGFERLLELERLDLTMEALILSLDYRSQVFSEEELHRARERLDAAEALSHSSIRMG